MKVLVLGSGGREHAIVWKLGSSKKISKLYVAPGNPGTEQYALNIDIAIDDIPGLINLVKTEGIEFVVVGPELPLSLGIVDELEKLGVPVFGPNKYCAQLESSKSFAKDVMISAGVPTANYNVVYNHEEAKEILKNHSMPVVLKADGLAAGKGVVICNNLKEAEQASCSLFNELKSDKLVIEDFLEGKEASFIVATDGTRIVPLSTAHDYKRIYDNDLGPNTGGMGTVSPTPNLNLEQIDWSVSNVIKPVLDEIKKRGQIFKGFLYAGLMISPKGDIKVLEFNCRLGDPETQVILPRLDSDLFDLLYSLTKGSDFNEEIKWSSEVCVCVVLASKGYPESAEKGQIITGAINTDSNNQYVFHAGTRMLKVSNSEKQLLTNGGRVLNIVAKASNYQEARKLVYNRIDNIQFSGMQYRKDIAL
jgi:phosphoribosylamine--glycine ligase